MPAALELYNILSESNIDLRQPVGLEEQLLKDDVLDSEVGQSMLQLLQVRTDARITSCLLFVTANSASPLLVLWVLASAAMAFPADNTGLLTSLWRPAYVLYSGILGFELQLCNALLTLPNIRLNTYMISSMHYLGKLDAYTTHFAAHLHAVAPMLHLCTASASFTAGNDVSLYMLGCLLLTSSCIRSCTRSCLLLLSSES